MKSHDFAQADCHVGVARKIEIELHGIGNDRDPSGASVHRHQIASKQCIHLMANDICNEYLFGKTNHETVKTLQAFRPVLLPVPNFVRDVAVAYNRSGDELWEHDDVEHVIGETFHRGMVASVGIHDIGDGLECEEGDADGQQHFREGERLKPDRRKQRVQVVNEEVRIFEIG